MTSSYQVALPKTYVTGMTTASLNVLS